MVCFLITDNAPRPFLGLRCGVPPRQTQTNNDASGNPQRVAGRPPEYPPGRPLRNRIQAMGMNADTGHKKYTAHGLVRRGCPKGQPAREIQPQPIQVSWQVFTSHEPRATIFSTSRGLLEAACELQPATGGAVRAQHTICEIFFLLFMGELRTIGLY